MRKFTLSSALVAAFSFGLVACDSGDSGTEDTADSTQTETDSTQTETDSTQTDSDTTAEETENDTTQDTDTVDPCDPNPCTGKAATCSADGQLVTYSGGTCAAGECSYTENKTACDGGEVCLDGACIAGGDACTYDFDQRVSYVTSIAVGNQGASDTCCFDFDNDGTKDNSLGDLLKTAGGLLGLDINATISEQIASGGLTLLLETKGVEDVTTDSSVDVFGFYGEDADADTANNAAGTSHFTVNPSSFQTGTASPLIGFQGATIASGTLAAGPDLFRLSLPVVGAQLDLTVSLTKLETKVAVGPNGSGLTMGGETELGGMLGGVIKKTDLYAALNAYVGTCTCVTFNDPNDTALIGDDGKCNAANTSACGDNDGEACKQLPSLCSTLLAFIQPDVDTACWDSGSYNAGDCSGTKDAISVGVWVKATSGAIDGVLECAE